MAVINPGVTSVGTTGTVSGITLTGGPITSVGTVTLGGTLDLSSPPAIGSTAANTGAFTTLSASSTVSGTGFSTYLASPPNIGGTTAAAGTFTTLIGGGGSANYGQLTGGATTKAVQFQTLGSDTNISQVFQSKGTGAIDLAAGSSGVNISNGGTVTAITRTAGGTGYTVAPTVTISAPTTAGGVQATATCTVTAGVVDTAFTITNAGSGYVEQPTITFTPVSGGSGAAAYASVGAEPTIKSIFGSSTAGLQLATAGGTQFQLADTTTNRWVVAKGATTGGNPSLYASTGVLTLSGAATSGVNFYSNNIVNQQMAVTHTASAVNYVQVTGAATGNKAVISAQGSDGSVGLQYVSKALGYHEFIVSTKRTFQIGYTTANDVNYLQVNSNSAGNAPILSALGSDADVDLTLTPKGAGAVRFGTYTASVLTPTGYITIKDSGGTTRRLLVG